MKVYRIGDKAYSFWPSLLIENKYGVAPLCIQSFSDRISTHRSIYLSALDKECELFFRLSATDYEAAAIGKKLIQLTQQERVTGRKITL